MHPFLQPSRSRSPLQTIQAPELTNKGIRLSVKRDDLLHPVISGNKWRKLKYNLLTLPKNTKGILTFGGAYSNHLVATAAASHLLNYPSVGIVRGEEDPHNQSLQFCRQQGMQLEFWTRGDYRQKDQLDVLDELRNRFPNHYFLPEGGSNALALRGAGELVDEMLSQASDVSHIMVAAGTGGTAAGILQALPKSIRLEVIAALKGDFLKNTLSTLAPQAKAPWKVWTDYHFGGYAKSSPQLWALLNQIYRQHQLPLDPIYTGKVGWAFWDLLHQDWFPAGSHVVLIHTGGLQGLVGFEQRKGKRLDYSFQFPESKG